MEREGETHNNTISYPAGKLHCMITPGPHTSTYFKQTIIGFIEGGKSAGSQKKNMQLKHGSPENTRKLSSFGPMSSSGTHGQPTPSTTCPWHHFGRLELFGCHALVALDLGYG